MTTHSDLELQIVTSFNNYLMSLIKQLSLACPNSIIANNKDWVISFIYNQPNKFIELFMYYILKDKDRIDAGDDDYFLSKRNYNEIVTDFTTSHGGENSSLLEKVFEFQTIWYQLNINNRLAIKEYMKILCDLSLDYFKLQDAKSLFDQK